MGSMQISKWSNEHEITYIPPLHISGKTVGDNEAPSGMEQKAIKFYQNQLAYIIFGHLAHNGAGVFNDLSIHV